MWSSFAGWLRRRDYSRAKCECGAAKEKAENARQTKPQVAFHLMAIGGRQRASEDRRARLHMRRGPSSRHSRPSKLAASFGVAFLVHHRLNANELPGVTCFQNSNCSPRHWNRTACEAGAVDLGQSGAGSSKSGAGSSTAASRLVCSVSVLKTRRAGRMHSSQPLLTRFRYALPPYVPVSRAISGAVAGRAAGLDPLPAAVSSNKRLAADPRRYGSGSPSPPA